MMEFEIIEGARRGSKVLYILEEKQLYTLKCEYLRKNNIKNQRYSCYVNGCHSSVTLENGIKCIKYNKNSHSSHGQQEAKYRELKLKSSIKANIANNALNINDIQSVFNEECERQKESANLVSFNKMKRQLLRIKSDTLHGYNRQLLPLHDTVKLVSIIWKYNTTIWI